MSKDLLFGNLERSERERDEIVSGNRAITAALARTSQHHKPFIRRAESKNELTERVALLEPTIRTAVIDVCQEHTYEDVERVMSIVLADLHNAGGHEEGCDCKFCEHMNSDKDDEEDEYRRTEQADYDDKNPPLEDSHLDMKDASKTAQGEGSTYQGESLDLGANRDGVQDVGSPKIDKKRVPADGLDTIDIGSKDHPHELQSMDELKQGESYQSGRDFEPDSTKRPRKTVDADEAMQSEHNVAPHTDTWQDGPGSAVTEKALAKVAGTKWSVIESGR